MKNLFYDVSNFKKAVVRNCPTVVYFSETTDEFFFATQKASINLTCDNSRNSFFIREWLKTQGIRVDYVRL